MSPPCHPEGSGATRDLPCSGMPRCITEESRGACYDEACWDEQPLRDLGDPSIGVEGRLFLPLVVRMMGGGMVLVPIPCHPERACE